MFVKSNHINVNEFDMLGCRDCDIIENWNSNFVDDDTSNHVMHFISYIRHLNAIVCHGHVNSYSFETLGRIIE